MASDFGSKFAAAGLAKLLDRMAESVTYAPVAGGSSSTRSMILNPLDENQEYRRGIWTGSYTSGDRPGDRITDAHGTWTVVGITPDADTGATEYLAHLPKLDT